jgi:hypothetical protein
VSGFGVGLVIGGVGWSYGLWRRVLGAPTRQWIHCNAWKWWVPVGLVTLFTYFAEPGILRRAEELVDTDLLHQLTPNCTITMLDDIVTKAKGSPKTIVVVTGVPAANRFQNDLQAIFSEAANMSDGRLLLMAPPIQRDYPELAPLVGKTTSGITIHGDSKFADLLMRVLPDILPVQRIYANPSGLLEHYHHYNIFTEDVGAIVWVEVGSEEVKKSRCRGGS